MASQVTRMPTLVDTLLPPLRRDALAVRVAQEAVVLTAFALLVAVAAQVAVRLPFTPVPITGQTFGALVAGGALGAWRGAGALGIYLLMGTAGLPVFSPSASAMAGKSVHLVLPWQGSSGPIWDIASGGYILGFVFAAAAVGYLAQRGWDRKPHIILAMLLGNVLIYVPGLLWLGFLIASGWVHPVAQEPLAELIPGATAVQKTLVGGLYPFIAGDLLKLVAASLALPSAWALVRRFRS